ncbi:cache domain-containing protein [Desulfovibrio litoralis]|uniref:Single Cache domain-containing protein n=1 Tax=Desulfovibrio litoralis DSM 11393 TaxID=1121455 RepID=A0A1M7TAV4_9BACT|nr:cache domain-containing protein [Desulfovibrio litoralis]SHN67869.1 hypothetical protein SAMN02745728_01793 [Desulfovibrio litoralis DSM 11393]
MFVNIRIFYLLCVISCLTFLPLVSVAEETIGLSFKDSELITRQKEIYSEEDFRLQASLSVLSDVLGNLIQGLDPKEQQALVKKSLDGIFIQKEAEADISLWEGGVVIYSPLIPDSVGVNFINVYDLTGSYFVQDMLKKASKGGGFVEYAMHNQGSTEWTLRRAYVAPLKNSNYWIMSWRILTSGKYAQQPKDDFLALLQQKLPAQSVLIENKVATTALTEISTIDVRVNTLQKTVFKWFLFFSLLCFCSLLIFLVYCKLFKDSPLTKKKR